MNPGELLKAGFRDVGGVWMLVPMSMCQTEVIQSDELRVLGAAEMALMTGLRRVMSRRAVVELERRRAAEAMGPDLEAEARLKVALEDVLQSVAESRGIPAANITVLPCNQAPKPPVP